MISARQRSLRAGVFTIEPCGGARIDYPCDWTNSVASDRCDHVMAVSSFDEGSGLSAVQRIEFVLGYHLGASCRRLEAAAASCSSRRERPGSIRACGAGGRG